MAVIECQYLATLAPYLTNIIHNWEQEKLMHNNINVKKITRDEQRMFDISLHIILLFDWYLLL